MTELEERNIAIAESWGLPLNPEIGKTYQGKRWNFQRDTFMYQNFVYKKDTEGNMRWHDEGELLNYKKGETTSELYEGQFIPELLIFIGAMVFLLTLLKK